MLTPAKLTPWTHLGVVAASLGAFACRGSTVDVGDYAVLAANLDAAILPYANEVAADSPALYLHLGEANGPSAVDATGHFNGVYPATGVTYGVAGALLGDANTAVALDGSSGISMPPGLDFAGAAPFSLELWADQTQQPNLGFTLDHDDTSMNRVGWDLLLGMADVSFERWEPSDSAPTTAGSVVTSNTPLSPGMYHHVVATFDGAQLRLYVDAALQGSNVMPSALVATGVTWMIGHENCSCTGSGYIGSLDEVAIYAHALPEDRIAAHYAAAGR